MRHLVITSNQVVSPASPTYLHNLALSPDEIAYRTPPPYVAVGSAASGFTLLQVDPTPTPTPTPNRNPNPGPEPEPEPTPKLNPNSNPKPNPNPNPNPTPTPTPDAGGRRRASVPRAPPPLGRCTARPARRHAAL